MPRHSSRLDQAINPEMSCGVGRAAASDREWTRMVYRGSARGKGLGVEGQIPSAAFTGRAMDTLNGGPMLRSEIVLFQRGEA